MEKLYQLAKSKLGTDIAKTQNELGCAEAVSFLLAQVTPNFPNGSFLSTTKLFNYLSKNPNFKLTDGYKLGRIIITPTDGKKIGHTGICGSGWVMSNNSMNGLWQANYKISTDAWRNYYEKKLGLKTYFFDLIGNCFLIWK